METNELPEEVKRKAIDLAMKEYFSGIPVDQIWVEDAYLEGTKTGYRLALQSKDEELDKLALELSETIIEKDELFDIAEKMKFNVEAGDARIQSLTAENERLKKERDSRAEHKRLNDEIAELTKPKQDLQAENERLRDALIEFKQLCATEAISWEPGTMIKLMNKIYSILSQSTDKQHGN